jgi:hypothetical protein
VHLSPSGIESITDGIWLPQPHQVDFSIEARVSRGKPIALNLVDEVDCKGEEEAALSALGLQSSLRGYSSGQRSSVAIFGVYLILTAVGTSSFHAHFLNFSMVDDLACTCLPSSGAGSNEGMVGI